MQPNFIRAGVLAIVISFVAMLSWEIHLRHKGMILSFDDNEALWAAKRAMAYLPADKATVFIGSSRIKFDLDIPMWREITGTEAIQLANVGSSPRAVLTDLANDKNFKGNLIVDVTEGTFFGEGAPYDKATNKKIAYYKGLTPTQRFSFQVNHALESQFVFLDQDHYSINGMLDNLQLFPPRPGVFPGIYFPIGFTLASYDRQSFMTPEFAADTSQQNAVKGVWAYGFKRRGDKKLPPDKLDAIFNSVKADVDKIKARGGQVLFVRTPSSGFYWEQELKGYPRDKYWDRLLTFTDCKGIYFKDYPATASFICPEWSHLSPTDVPTYTKAFIAELHDLGWPINNKPVPQ